MSMLMVQLGSFVLNANPRHQKEEKYTRIEAGLTVSLQQTLVRECACSSWFTVACGDQIKPNYALLM